METKPEDNEPETEAAPADPLEDVKKLFSETVGGIMGAITEMGERVGKLEAKPTKAPAPRKVAPVVAKSEESTESAPEKTERRSHGRSGWLYGR